MLPLTHTSMPLRHSSQVGSPMLQRGLYLWTPLPTAPQVVPSANSISQRPIVAASAGKPSSSEPDKPPARGKGAPKPPKPQQQAKESSRDADIDPKGPPRAPKAQRQLFGVLSAMRSGQPAAAFQDKPSDTRKPKAGLGKGGAKQQGGGPRSRRSPSGDGDDGPPDVMVLGPAGSNQPPSSPKPSPAAAATIAVGAVATAAAVAPKPSAPPAAATKRSSKVEEEPEEEDEDEVQWNIKPEDGEDGSQVWRDKLAEVGWAFDEDEEEEDEEGEDDEDEEEDLELDQMLVEVDPYGAWFAGESEQVEETSQQKVLRQAYTDKAYVWPTSWGPIKASMVAGRGRAITAASQLQLGDLVMVSRPLGMLEYDADEGEDAAPENEELADMMMKRSRLTADQQVWLDELLMSEPPPASGSFRYPRLPSEEELQALRKTTGATSLIKINDDAARQRMYRLVNLNVLGEEFKELAASSLRQQDAPGYLGVWPDAALINHSCAPNATYWALGDRLVVRATEVVEAGQEVTLSYLGALLTSPLPVRQAELQDKWGFKCTCQRCKAEERVAGSGSELGALVMELHEWCKDLNEVLNNALEDEDMEEVADIRLDLIQRKDEFEAAMRTAKASSKARRWLQASVYDMYDMLSLCADEDNSAAESAPKGGKGSKGGPKRGPAPDGLLDTENLAVCARILESVSRGTDAQAYLAAEYMVRAGVRFGAQHHEALEAKKLCRSAFIARFGPVSDSMLDQLIAARLDD